MGCLPSPLLRRPWSRRTWSTGTAAASTTCPRSYPAIRGASPPSLGRRAAVRDGDADFRPEAETAADLHAATHERSALAHLDETEPGSPTEPRVGGADVESVAVVLHHSHDEARKKRDDGVHALRTSVAKRVVDGLLEDPVHRDLRELCHGALAAQHVEDHVPPPGPRRDEISGRAHQPTPLAEWLEAGNDLSELFGGIRGRGPAAGAGAYCSRRLLDEAPADQ